jgi:hypothetical protein
VLGAPTAFGALAAVASVLGAGEVTAGADIEATVALDAMLAGVLAGALGAAAGSVTGGGRLFARAMASGVNLDGSSVLSP